MTPLRLVLAGACVLASLSTTRAETPGPVVAENAASSSATTQPATGSERPPRVTLDEITIEGEIDVPQVLFIGARDHLRPTASLHALYLIDVDSLARMRPPVGPLAPPPVDAPPTRHPESQQEK